MGVVSLAISEYHTKAYPQPCPRWLMISTLKSFARYETQWIRRHEMLAMVTFIAAIHFLIEAVIMFVLADWLLTGDVIKDGLIDATLLTVFSTPPIYYWVVKPFIVSSRQAKEALAAEAADKSRLASHREETLVKMKGLLDHNEDLRSSLKAAAQQIADLNERMLQRVSADLHDGPAQLLTYAMMRLGKFEPIVAAAGRPQDGEEFQLLKASVADCLRQVRDTCNGLSLPQLNSLDLQQTVSLAVTQHNEQTGGRVSMRFQALPRETSLAAKVCLYRVVQESLTNGHKHGKARGQHVAAAGPDPIVVTISDNGTGFDSRQIDGAGLGIAGMRARVESLGGTLTLTSAPGVGTEVKVRIDLTARDDDRERGSK